MSHDGDRGPKGAAVLPLRRRDFVSDQEVRWCPGCGDYSILAQTQKMLPDLNIPRENFVFVSGIGCSSRFPYYVNTYGFHGIHGRAPTLATGIKASRPELSVWVITGDGDALSIGGNHFMHVVRRNLDVNIILFNNRIYGLTKGQYSPTSEFGKKTKSTPLGSIDYPINPLCIAISNEATFVARSIDVDVKHLSSVLTQAAHHKGVSFVEVFQNCNIFNDGAFKHFSERGFRDDRTIRLEHGKPLVFGRDRDKGIRLNGLKLEVVDLRRGNTEKDLLIHDIHAPEPNLANLLARMDYPDFPVPLGVFRSVAKPTYDELMEAQVQDAISRSGDGDLERLLNSGDVWVVN
ncbi:MAG: 2-oxoacid:ferredoxin oxidoreductase subunit beta [Acidobacteria bacterium]|nr:2-oxoacid:ferredoxin oxidoreductase subunit beta [Acidobacteriota bacterium]